MSASEKQLKAFAKNRLCVLRDDIGDNRSVLVAPAADISAAEVNRIISLTGGLTFVAVSAERASAFMLSPMPGAINSRASLSSGGHLAQYISVEAREGVTTGISAADRACTLRVLGCAHPHPRSLVKPGHIFPVATRSGGCLVKAEIPEAALDIVTLSGFSDAALFVDFLDRDGGFISADAASEIARAEELPVFTISELIRHRLIIEPLVARLSEASLPTLDAGTVQAIAYRSKIHDVEHIALVKGEIDPQKPALVRVQVENTVADVFGGSTPSTRQQLKESLKAISEHGSGVLLYLRRGSLIDSPLFSVQAETEKSAPRETSGMREYGVGAQILRDLGVTQIELLSSTQKHLIGLDSFGISVVSQRPIPNHHPITEEQRP